MLSDQQTHNPKKGTPEWLSRVTIIAVGVGKYTYCTDLDGPAHDIANLHNLLVDNPNTALYPESQFITVSNPSSGDLRHTLAEYAMGRSASHDILVFYFSGHAIRIGANDLGLCTKDTCPNPCFDPPAHVPLNLVRYSDIIETLAAVKVDPIIILDTCFSGRAEGITNDIYSRLKRIIQAETGSTYALLCSSTKLEQTLDHNTGGPFTTLLSTVASKGCADKKRQYTLDLRDLYPLLRQEIETNFFNTTPQLFVGETLPEFGLVRNVEYSPRQERLNETQLRILAALWNRGSPTTLSIHQMAKEINPIAYTIHTKLSYSPGWVLIEGPKSDRRLTTRGKRFMKGELRIPFAIQKNPSTGEWIAAPNSETVSFEELFRKKIKFEKLLQDSFVIEDKVSCSDQCLRDLARDISDK